MTYFTASTPGHYQMAENLFREYADSLDFELNFQNFSNELGNLPVMYGPPDGAIILATKNGHEVGCIAIRKIEPGTGELKRMYVKPAYRGRGIARRLLELSLAESGQIGYEYLKLDTVSSMTDAIKLYKHYGFVITSPYCYNPLPDAVYMEKKLNESLE